ncbi:penicillin acylase family protein [Falsiroseomonas selenitidurans]|uniref:Penicillin acylase family protein n=1 Tax=Falsiroseomonas selenitidurans TaxID=2716335 RepID=A0ABX1DWI5_9PROT|nr:penicillin acylase family protein [Falsiroseomonas selenitidurans]NKC29284.1 penicillin acylase family protein [Falsiroseomonas selenitidurans]
MRFLLRLLGRLLLLAFILAGFAAAFAMALVFTSLPDAREELAIPTLSAPVAITLDGQGIPRIRAANERDAAVAMGWLHARDRMFQMEVMRRGAAGRLAELAGPAALRLDRFSRTLGLLPRAEADLAALDATTRDLLDAYAEGVNALLAVRGRLAAPEFLVLGEPEPWKPEHSLLWGKVMGLWLSGNWRRELERAALDAALPAEKVEDLWPRDASPGRPDLAAALPPGLDLAGLLRQVPVFGEDAPLPASASNAWVVAPRRSASGAALLASDPHLGFNAPVLWYLARIDLPDGAFRAGATAPGVPAIVIGRNQSLAWGFTTTHSDTQDLFLERLAGPDHYETPDGPRPFTVREEVIAVRGQEAPERLLVRETRHGPVVSGLEPRLAESAEHVFAVAMANLAPGDTTATALLALNRATSVAEARAAAATFSAPPQTLLVADAAGRIAQYLVGRTPVRAGGDGSLPGRGWDGSADWTGFVPFDAMPHVEDPESGQIVNANARPAPPGHPVFLGRDWYGDWRLRRIQALLAARPQHDAAGFAAMQNDVLSLLAAEILPVLRQVVPPAGLPAQAHALLRDWDGTMRAEAPQPLIHHAWLHHFEALALRAGGAPEGTGAGPEFLARLLLDPARGAAWCGAEGCGPLLTRALGEAAAELAAAHGNDPAAWRWGAAHVARFEHPLLRFVPLLGAATRLEAATGGDGETISRGGMRGSGTNPFLHQHGAGLRAVFDLADPDGTLAIIATGQSGHPLSDNFASLLQRWQEGGVLRLTRHPEIETGAIRLTP